MSRPYYGHNDPGLDDDSCELCGGIDYCRPKCPRGRAPGDAQMDDAEYGEVPPADETASGARLDAAER